MDINEYKNKLVQFYSSSNRMPTHAGDDEII